MSDESLGKVALPNPTADANEGAEDILARLRQLKESERSVIGSITDPMMRAHLERGPAKPATG